MQRLINAIDQATRAGVYSLEETANILQAIDQVGQVVKDHNIKMAKQKEEAEKAQAQEVPGPFVIKKHRFLRTWSLLREKKLGT